MTATYENRLKNHAAPSPIMEEASTIGAEADARIQNLEAEVHELRSSVQLQALQDEIRELRAAMQSFVDKVDRGEARSRETYQRFKKVLEGESA